MTVVKIKKQKPQKMCVIKKLKFQDFKYCLEATHLQLEIKVSLLEKNKVDVDSIRKSREEFIKSKKIVLKSQQGLRNEKHNVFTEEVNKTLLSANNDKRIQSNDSIEIYVYGTRRDLVCKKEQIECNIIIKQYKN